MYRLAFALFAAGSLAAAETRPNIIWIVADDLGYADVGFQGATDIPTPHLDRLAREGARFTDGYVPAAMCSPTRAGVLTGRWQNRFGHEYNGPKSDPDVGLDVRQRTIADRLGTAGYATAAVGKWHLGFSPRFHPLQRGFASFRGFLGGGHDYLTSTPSAPPYDYKTALEVDGKARPLQGYLTTQLGQLAAQYVRQAAGEKPFFLYLAFNAPHSPFQATPELLARVQHVPDQPPAGEALGKGGQPKAGRRTYAAMVVAMDDAVGAVLKALDDRKIADDTLIAFISDNGGPRKIVLCSNAPLRGEKGDLYEGGMRTPFVIRYPHRYQSAVISTPVTALDLSPTACALAGAPMPSAETDGVDLTAHLAGGAAPAERDLCWRMNNNGERGALRRGPWKYVRIQAKGATAPSEQLFDLSRDISEQHDLAAAEPQRLAALREAWQAWERQMVPPAWPTDAEQRTGKRGAKPEGADDGH